MEITSVGKRYKSKYPFTITSRTSYIAQVVSLPRSESTTEIDVFDQSYSTAVFALISCMVLINDTRYMMQKITEVVRAMYLQILNTMKYR